MPIMSYLVYPASGKKLELKSALEAIPGCEVVPAENKELLVLVTDTSGPEAEEELQQIFATIPSLECLALVSGFESERFEENIEGAQA